MIECAVATRSFLAEQGQASADEEKDKAEQHSMRFSQLQRQCAIIATMVDDIHKHVKNNFFMPVPSANDDKSLTSEAHESIHAAVASASTSSSSSSPAPLPSLNPSTLRSIACLCQYGLVWLTLAFQVWSVVVPNKKTFKKKSKAAAKKSQPSAAVNQPKEAEMSAEQEASLLEPILATRTSIAAVIKATRDVIGEMKSLCKRVAGRLGKTGASASSLASAAASAASNLSAAPTISGPPSFVHTSHLTVFRSASASAPTELDYGSDSSKSTTTTRASATPSDAATIMNNVILQIDYSHAVMATNIGNILQACDQTLQTIKL